MPAVFAERPDGHDVTPGTRRPGQLLPRSSERALAGLGVDATAAAAAVAVAAAVTTNSITSARV